MGFPQGGDNLSITSGVVSRIELTNYAHGAAQLLAIQLDAAPTRATAADPRWRRRRRGRPRVPEPGERG